MALSLRKYYPDFYKEFGALIWVATALLALPLFMRALNSHLYAKDAKYTKFYMSHFAFVNSSYIFFSSIIPIMAQMASMIFGARHQYKKK